MANTVTLALTDLQIQKFHTEGYLVIRDFFTQEEVHNIRDTFMAEYAEGPPPGLAEINPNYAPDDPLARYPRAMHPHKHPQRAVGPLSMRYMLDARIAGVLSALYHEEPIAAQSMFYFKPPGARGQDLHQDNYYLRVAPGTCIAAWVAVDAADEENGGLVVVPGSNHLDVICPERSDPTRFFTGDHVNTPHGMREVAVNLDAGDVLFFNGSLIHGSYPNSSTDRFRRSFICHYISKSSAEISRGYRPLYRFNGEEVTMAEATGGGPCGTPHLAASLH